MKHEETIKYMAEKILERIGNKLNHPDDYLGNSGYSETRYKFDNLDICFIDGIFIKFHGNPVFNTEKGVIRHGAWENLLEEIYYNLKILETNKMNKEAEYNRKKQHCISLMKVLSKKSLNYGSDGYSIWDSNLKLFNSKPLLNFDYNDTTKSRICYIKEIDVSLEITRKNGYESGYSLMENIPSDYYYYKIYTNNKLCCEFHGFNNLYANYDVFVIGSWEEKLINYIQQKELELEEKEQNIEKNEILDSIKRLKKIL